MSDSEDFHLSTVVFELSDNSGRDFDGWMEVLLAWVSRVAQWKRAGPITQRSVDRNHALLTDFPAILTNTNSSE